MIECEIYIDLSYEDYDDPEDDVLNEEEESEELYTSKYLTTLDFITLPRLNDSIELLNTNIKGMYRVVEVRHVFNKKNKNIATQVFVSNSPFAWAE